MVDTVIKSYDGELELLDDGIPIYCHATKFAFLCGMIGGLPARHKFSGLTVSSAGGFPCTFCEATQIVTSSAATEKSLGPGKVWIAYP